MIVYCSPSPPIEPRFPTPAATGKIRDNVPVIPS